MALTRGAPAPSTAAAVRAFEIVLQAVFARMGGLRRVPMCVYGYKGRRIMGRARRRGVRQDLRGAVLAHHILQVLRHLVR